MSRLSIYEEKLLTQHGEIINNIKAVAEDEKHSITSSFKTDLLEEIELTIKERKLALESELDDLIKKKRDTEDQLRKLKEDNARAINNLPSKVELEDIRRHYADKLRNSNSYYDTVESFETEHGTISFQASDFDFKLIPSTGHLAWIRIGKDNSTLNSEIIEAWLEAAIWSKEKQGYINIEDDKSPTDYGQAHARVFKKGDMYFKAYYQYSRVSGTYGRHSLQYKFYIEIGSFQLKEQARLEDYNQKIGS